MPTAHRFACNLCEALCGLQATLGDDGLLQEIRGDPDDVLSNGHLCPKGAALRDLDRDPDRPRTPLRRTAQGWEALSWDEALAEAGATRCSRRPTGPGWRAIESLEYVVAVDFYRYRYLSETSRRAHLILPLAPAHDAGNYEVVLLNFAVRNLALQPAAAAGHRGARRLGHSLRARRKGAGP